MSTVVEVEIIGVADGVGMSGVGVGISAFEVVDVVSTSGVVDDISASDVADVEVTIPELASVFTTLVDEIWLGTGSCVMEVATAEDVVVGIWRVELLSWGSGRDVVSETDGEGTNGGLNVVN